MQAQAAPVRRQMPISLIAAEAAIALWVVYIAVSAGMDIESGAWQATTIIHLAWSVPALIGIPSGSRGTWSFVSTVLLMIGVLGGIFGGVAGIYIVVSGHHESLLSLSWYVFGVLYMFLVYYLLNRPTARSYFGVSGDKSKSGVMRQAKDLRG